jgi:hypothetical protein
MPENNNNFLRGGKEMKKLFTICAVIMMFGADYARATETWTTIGYPGASDTAAFGISGNSVVGYYYDGYGKHGFLYNGTGWTPLNYPGANLTQSMGIGGNSIVGFYYDSSGEHGFLYDGTSYTTLTYPGATIATWASGISGNSIVGTYTDSSYYGHAFLYNGTSWISLDYPEAKQVTEAYDISGSSIVGAYTDSAYNAHGFLYNMTTQSWTTLDYPGAIQTWVVGISGNDVVGQYTDSFGNAHGFLYNAYSGGTWTALNYPGAKNTSAYGIDGSSIVGAYVDSSGNEHGFLYTIPEPAAPPVADADGPYTVFVGDTLTLDGSGSTDDDNDIVSYMWDLDDNNSFETDAGGQAIFDVNFAYLQSIGLLVNNIYNIHLKVTDSKGQSDVNDTTLTIVPKPALVVAVDIKPGGCPNPLNVKSSGVLPVAILGTAELDVSTIVPTSIQLAGVEAIRNSYEDVAAPSAVPNDCNCTEGGPDGLIDLTLKFRTQEIVEAIGEVNEGDVLTLELTGVLFGERPIEGADCVVIRGRHKPFNSADINKDGVVNGIDFAVIAENWLESSGLDD